MNSKNYFDQLAEFSSEIRKLTLKRLEDVPEGFINWRINNTAMSFVDIVQHLINIDELFFNITKTNERRFKWTLGTKPHLNVDKLTYKSMVKKLEKLKIRRDSTIRSFNDILMNELVIDENGEKMTFWWFLMHKVLEHEIYHRGQVAAYLKVIKGESSEI